MRRGEFASACAAFNAAFLAFLPDQSFRHWFDGPDQDDEKLVLFAADFARRATGAEMVLETAICDAAMYTRRFRYAHLSEPAEVTLRRKLNVWSTDSGSPMSRKVAAVKGG